MQFSAIDAFKVFLYVLAVGGTFRLLALRNQDAPWAQGLFKVMG